MYICEYVDLASKALIWSEFGTVLPPLQNLFILTTPLFEKLLIGGLGAKFASISDLVLYGPWPGDVHMYMFVHIW